LRRLTLFFTCRFYRATEGTEAREKAEVRREKTEDPTLQFYDPGINAGAKYYKEAACGGYWMIEKRI
jgi:hypothetical protein